MRDPLVLPVAALATGIASARLLPFEPHSLWLSLAVFCSFAWISRARKYSNALLASWLAILWTAGVLTAMAHEPEPAPTIEAAAREVLILEGCVVEPSVFSPDREQFTLELDRDARARVSLYPREGESAPALHYGQSVQVEATLREPRNFQNPGAFDYAGYLARSHIYWTASVNSVAGLRILPGECGSRFWRPIFDLRSAALHRIESLYGKDGYASAMMQAILIGETTNLEKVWTEHFRRSGTYHALVISGLHVTVLAASLMFVLRLCFVPEMAGLLLATLGAWLYALVSGWQAPVVRAAGGFTLYLVGRCFYRRRQILNLLAAVALPILLLDPLELYDTSFQLSFLSVAVIGALASPILDAAAVPYGRGSRNLRNLDLDLHLEPRIAEWRVELRLIAETVALYSRAPYAWILHFASMALRVIFAVLETVLLSAVMQVGLALPMILYFHRVSLSGLSANVLIVPLLNFVIPVGFVAVFTGWRWPANLAAALLRLSETIAAWHARWEPNHRVPDPPLWIALAFCAALLAACAAVHRSRRWKVCSFVALSAIFAVLMLHPFPPGLKAGELELDMIDVGQGESLLLALPDGRAILVDGGGIPSFGKRRPPRMDIGEDVVSPYLWHRGIRRLEIVAMTHAHTDHCGGLPAVLENFRPRQLWIGAVEDDHPDWIRVRDKAQSLGIPVVRWQRGDTRSLGEVRFQGLAPGPEYRTRAVPHNNDSLVLQVSFRDRSLLLTGDIEKQIEWDLVDRDQPRPVDILKVPHHGSRTSSTTEFLDRLHPRFALISAGYANLYRLPSEETMRRLAEQHAGVLRTDHDGLISVRTDGRRLWVETFRTGLSP